MPAFLTKVLQWLAQGWLGRWVLDYVWGKIKAMIEDWLRKRGQEKSREDVAKAIDAIKEAQKEPDDAKRVENVSKANCELEKALGFDSDCDAKPRDR